MEKLQRALNEARIAREKALGLPPLTQPATSAAKPAAPMSSDRSAPPLKLQSSIDVLALWDELMPYEPNPDHLLKNRILTLNAEQASNPFDVLRTKIVLLMKQNGWKRLAITSPNKSSGKTTTACNLAIGLSRQRERRAMLFDMDMRRPSISRMLGRKPQHGIKAMLTGAVTPSDQLLCLRGNVALSLNTSVVSDSTQLMMSGRTVEMLDQIQVNYEPDIMIFDLPPMFATDDARAFLKNVDCAIIIAQAEHTKTSLLDQCEREVAEQTNVLGVVLNSCRHMGPENSYDNTSY